MAAQNKDSERDATLNAARYRLARELEETPLPTDESAQATGRSFTEENDKLPATVHYSAEEEVWEVANSALDAAFARGDFDNLAYAGKPIPGLGTNQDPDWWVKGMMEREKISGVGPPALLLRKEDAELESTVDALNSPAQVRELLDDFNSRIINARRQLNGGPPVITKLRDVTAELHAWEQRRRLRTATVLPTTTEVKTSKASWFKRLFQRG
ncbi:hypothetical protein CQ018_03855 [Arthrobacter sp. MYb227]|uniref:DnaJ family domain-containing protein n=1 Tax=Arthrobacter sp. MYb227 TaxID=1848601 RepID=UPI000CFE16B6|nr:DUF1992 domain-containing protein [Arthrobacter sp. MYb227]PQZ96398.1 hypothetical protein CQ018_03855 [Arthrobacter sp. MYb227]